jgi:hypothetical protein
MDTEQLLSRLLRLLQGAIRVSGATQIEIDEKIGRRRGYLSHVFQRRVDLKLVDMLKVIAALELDPGQFFSPLVTGQQARRLTTEDLMSLLAGSFESASPTPRRPQASQGEDELESLVRDAVRRILREGDLPTHAGEEPEEQQRAALG